MINRSLDYCINSTDENNYQRIRCNLPCPNTEYCKVQVTTLTAQCELVILSKNDYIIIEYTDEYDQTHPEMYEIGDDYTDCAGAGGIETILNTVIKKYDKLYKVLVLETN